jgi:cyclopropane fatty-acyl-phospholipid synthase-like methyltransferase
MFGSSEQWGLNSTHFHGTAGGGAVHSIKSGHESFTRVLEGEFSQDNTSVTALANLPLYFATISRLLKPDGALLNHGIINADVTAPAREVRLAARSLTAIFFWR